MGNPLGYMKLTTRSKKSKSYYWGKFILSLVDPSVQDIDFQGHGNPLPANLACRGKPVGARCLKRCCSRNPRGNCCARSKAEAT